MTKVILALRTDSPDAEVYLYEGSQKLVSHTWHADRQLAKDLLKVIHEKLQSVESDWADVSGIVVFEGPGSFTGLRIGITVANTLAYGQQIPIIAAQGDNWLKEGLKRLQNSENDKIVLPHYGAEAHITLPKK